MRAWPVSYLPLCPPTLLSTGNPGFPCIPYQESVAAHMPHWSSLYTTVYRLWDGYRGAEAELAEHLIQFFPGCLFLACWELRFAPYGALNHILTTVEV